MDVITQNILVQKEKFSEMRQHKRSKISHTIENESILIAIYFIRNISS